MFSIKKKTGDAVNLSKLVIKVLKDYFLFKRNTAK